ncbi:MAG: Re/Si-specific NAD(P)(+) transhydrogenase subunit alpha [Alphaproteobacteria bacterium]|nr:MAG: Re/Si-specific NAD(P)(+) transhydrogenase subunit alpha [Alphaproteobacteria bacterium]
MAIFVTKETVPGEARVSLTPDIVGSLIKKTPVYVQKSAGDSAGFSDDAYRAVGALCVDSPKQTAGVTHVVGVTRPAADSLGISKFVALFDPTTVFLGTYGVLGGDQTVMRASWQKQTVYSLDLIPRISRAQSMDVLSSQANMAGYRAVLEAASCYGRSFPLMMTAAGTVSPAKVLVLGAGVAGLQAIATAKRLGAVVSAFDVRPAVREQVQSLGATFIAVDVDVTDDEKSGYATEMSAAYKERQSLRIAESVVKSDIVITTALIPGKQAPRLITDEMVASMRPGSVIVDMAAGSGGNCSLSKPDAVVVVSGVTIVGYTNLSSRLAQSCSLLYAKNVYNFLQLMWDPDTKSFTTETDEIVKAACVLHEGKIVYGKGS